MMRTLRCLVHALLGGLLVAPCFAQESAPPAAAAQTAADQAYYQVLESLEWVRGPTTVQIAGKSELVVPDGYVFLDRAGTDKYLELNRNLASGTEVLVAPADLHWAAYLSFEAEGYVKDSEKIDAAELLQAMQTGTEQSNDERRRRGWPELRILDWAVPPAYNSQNKRLEWATLLESEGYRNVNFSTKVLGRRGHTSIILVASQESLALARPELEAVLSGYSFKSGETYAEWVPGDKVAEYGLAALVLGGAAAVATKKGFWAILAGFLATGWKFLAAGAVAAAAGLRKFLGRQKPDDAN